MNRRIRIAGVIIGLIIVIVAAVRFFAPHLFPGLFTSIAAPFWRMEFSIYSGGLLSREDLLNQNEDLKRQLVEADARLKSLSSIESDNALMRSILGRPEFDEGLSTSSPGDLSGLKTPYILAAVLKHPPLSPYDEFIIDIGTDHGLSTTSLVYVPGNIPIGRVADVSSRTSKVILFSSPGERYEVLVGPHHAPATAIGRGGGQYEADLPRDIAVSTGDFVMIPSLSDRSFGIVTAVLSSPTMSFEKILFAPPVNLYEERWVLVKK